MWNQERIQYFIDNQVEENIKLDYKASASLQNTDGKKNEISKDVSAFANSDGGLIIYGLTEKNEGAKFLPESIDPINRLLFSKETLEQIINSRINPTIHGILIHPVTIGDANDNNVVYVVEIPKSNTAHQASDKRYYRRFNFQSVMMDDWEIKDIINRQNKTQAQISLRPLFSKGHEETWMKLDSAIQMEFEILAINTGQNVIHHIDFMVLGNATAESHIYNSKVVNGMVELYFTNEVKRKIGLEDNEYVINVQRMPILSKTFRVIGKIKLASTFFKSEEKLRLTIVTDDNRSSQRLTGIEIYNDLVKY